MRWRLVEVYESEESLSKLSLSFTMDDIRGGLRRTDLYYVYYEVSGER